ncbi:MULTISPECIES: adenylyl-sulfate kinase [unclassified Nocardioides]|uniref:adenylyl-sulfate kinase n=1 Tax=unclassified Nocardioides TaxID=2615069 RepID=UPI000056FAE0|nr:MULTISPECIES: adenylyl-sulfate kinase [unclassified Nocardioides]ABL83702.1 adenylylsulfate kinase [Nocardioides sp. JS614]
MPPVPQYCPTPRELDDLELLVTGALVPTVVFNEPGSPVTLTLPDDVAAAASAAGAVELVDPEGLPLAQVEIPAGTIDPLTHAQYGPFRRYYLTPAQTRERYAGRTFVPVVDALTLPQLEVLKTVGPVVLLPLVGHGTPELSPVALIRATIAAATYLPHADVVAIPLATRGDADVDHDLGLQVVANYAGEDPLVGVSDDPSGDYPPEVAEIVAFDRPAADEQGLVLFFTGLSGSGKSTLARALMDRLLEHGGRTVTSLDGDVVRRNLSAGLTFSKEDRETNIRRIGWVAAEISRHGGVAVCSPIAPFDETRQQVRAMVRDAGGAFFLVHVATPLEECERRDRKGLYAKARRGEIPEFTGISSPYEEPEDADVRVDTTGRTIGDALDDVIQALRASGHLDLTDTPPADTPPVVEQRAPADPPPVEQQPPADPPLAEQRAPAVPPLVEQRAPASVVETPEEKAGPPDLDPTAGQRPSRSDKATSNKSTPKRSTPLRVLYICTANICRSPFMELYSRHLAGHGTHVTFASAGTHGFVGREMDPTMAATLRARGVAGVSRFRSRPFSSDLMPHADLVLTAESTHRQFLLDDHPASFRKVLTIGQFAEAVRASGDDLSGHDLLAAVAERRGQADPSLDVGDPYGQGPEVAAVCADALDELLRVVVPALTGTRKISL